MSYHENYYPTIFLDLLDWRDKEWANGNRLKASKIQRVIDRVTERYRAQY